MTLNAYGECNYAEYRNKVRYDKGHYNESRYAECRGAKYTYCRKGFRIKKVILVYYDL